MSRLFAGVDLGGTNLRGIVVDLDGEVVAERNVAVGPERAAEQVCDRIGGLVEALAQDVGEHGSLAGVGVGVAGWIDKRSGRVRRAPNLGWVDEEVGGMLRSRLARGLGSEIRVEVVNDLTAVTYGEWAGGAAQGANDVLCVFVGSGLGAGLVLDGRLYEGASGVAGELGHVKVVDEGGRACGCGAVGCVEAYVGGRYLEERVRSEIQADPGRYPGAQASAAAADRDVTCDDIEAGCAAGDADCAALWAGAADRLGQALALAAQVLDPAVIVLGGGALRGAPTYRRLAVEAFERRCPPGLRVGVELRSPELGGRAGSVGAALLARDR